MANQLPSPSEVSGKYNAIFEAYLQRMDPKSSGIIEAMAAATFLKKSGLSDVVLSRIWDLSDPVGRGFLDKKGFFVALKLVSLAQAGHDINMRNIFIDTPNPPKVGEIPKIQPPKIQTVVPHAHDWSIKPADRQKYEQLFVSLQPVDGLIGGNKVRGVLMDSKLPLDTLSRIWDISDQDKDGSLDKIEFIVAMHLVYQALDKKAIPSSLPTELQRSKLEPQRPSNDFTADGAFVANFPTNIAPPVPPLPSSIPIMTRLPPTVPNVAPLISTDLDLLTTSPPAVDWVVTSTDQQRFGTMFKNCDLDQDGLVSGIEVKDVFLQSGIPQLCLAKIWALCDSNQSGKLTNEQFALAMWMVDRKRNGIEPPDCLLPSMIPPSQRSGGLMTGSIVGVDNNLMQNEPPPPSYANPELEMISKEIEELSRERRLLETDIAQKEADIRIKSGEVRSLQSELDTLAATLKQLENQKGEAQKRLDDLKNQKYEIDFRVTSVKENLKVTKEEVNKIREQCQKQEETIKEQEGELDSRRSELQKLKDEEISLEKEYDKNLNELQNVSKKLQDTQLQISQVKAMVSQLQESQRQMRDALSMCKTAIEASDPSLVSDYSLKLEPDFREARTTLEIKEEPKVDPFNDKSVGFDFKSNGFSSDAFVQGPVGFDDSFNVRSGFDDPFGNSFPNRADPFGSSSASDPFGDKRGVAPVTPDPNKDDFGSDPFAVLHAPTSASQILNPSPSNHRSSPASPSPALPEKSKKAKQPPPRPAPPRPMQGPTPTRTEISSGFGSSTGGFADFADFETKNTIEPLIATDFSEDPFKDYRYEDPFSITDPFADADNNLSADSNKPDSYFNLKQIDSKPTNNTINSNLKSNDKKNNNSTVTTNFAAFDEGFNNDMFAAFDSHFDKNEKSTNKGNIDAFGDSSTTTNVDFIANFDNVFKNNFEDEFSNMNIASNGNTDNEKKVSDKTYYNRNNNESNNAFNSMFCSSNKNILDKKTGQKASDKVSEKYMADFSKSDNFDKDLEEALKRSLVDQ